MDTLTNPILRMHTRVILEDGREALLDDDSTSLRTRRIYAATGQQIGVDRVHVSKITKCCAFGIWYNCKWD